MKNLIELYEETYEYSNRKPTNEDYDTAFYYLCYAVRKSLQNRELVFYVSKKFCRKNRILEEVMFDYCRKYFGFYKEGAGAVEFTITRQGVEALQNTYEEIGNDNIYNNFLLIWEVKE